MQQHQMKLATAPYNNIASGKKLIESRLFGENSRDFLLDQIKQFYPDEDEQKYGLIGIRFELLD